MGQVKEKDQIKSGEQEFTDAMNWRSGEQSKSLGNFIEKAFGLKREHVLTQIYPEMHIIGDKSVVVFFTFMPSSEFKPGSEKISGNEIAEKIKSKMWESWELDPEIDDRQFCASAFHFRPEDVMIFIGKIKILYNKRVDISFAFVSRKDAISGRDIGYKLGYEFWHDFAISGSKYYPDYPGKAKEILAKFL